MQFAAVFVEYFVTGSGAMFWILPILSVALEDLRSLGPGHVTLLLPLVYVVGMFLDVAASVLLGPAKRRARERKLPWRKEEKGDTKDPKRTCSRTAFVTLHSPELGTALQLRTSRDRIARGAWLNLAITAVVVLILPDGINYLLPGPEHGRVILFAAMCILCIGAFIGWWYAEHQTHRFKLEAYQAIESKNKEDLVRT